MSQPMRPQLTFNRGDFDQARLLASVWFRAARPWSPHTSTWRSAWWARIDLPDGLDEGTGQCHDRRQPARFRRHGWRSSFHVGRREADHAFRSSLDSELLEEPDMKYVARLRQLAWNTGLLVALASSGCATVPPRAERYVAPPSGSTWVNARVDTGSYGSSSTQLSMTRGERVWQGSDVITFETAEITLLTSPALDYIAQVKDDKVLVSWEPPYNLDWPLQVGKTSQRSYRMTVHPANRTVSYELVQKVEAYESVTTPAGTFKVFRYPVPTRSETRTWTGSVRSSASS